MSFREAIWDQKWLQPLLPNYLKPLKDPNINNEFTKEFVSEAEEFLSDLASLSELPRLNKTFKRNIKGYLFKVKIKPKKIHVELIDTKKSSSPIRKRIYITTYRKQVKSEKGFGKCVDATIYYQVENKTIVRNIQKHPLFIPIFYKINALDHSISGLPIDELPHLEITDKRESIKSHVDATVDQEFTIKGLLKEYQSLDTLINTKLEEIDSALKQCIEDINLLDIEEKHHLKRLVNHDLPQLLETYASLSKDQRLDSYDDVMTSLHSMRTYIETQTNHLKNTRMDRMQQLIRLNQIRYEIPLNRNNEQ
ncbi:hypothetical protein [Evansella cellulosilytica]|uniref:Uncharacterized protein n=1 Tax=Evansella cellulosilytica (strain ATCC 21833 / DSM 2522 / FERM P-1141 / JCM 9156 / N-4) TaxID=649639 RepID=E6U079_EVAC2|nr:hypothetical protein [Evansella cellulosilytica]ADU30195.1 hypothetical protein Bcell_1933 [Evansella cellulosilytica DSM 2522]